MSRDLKQTADRVLRSAKKAGATDAEAFVQANRQLEVEVRDGRAASVTQADSRGLGLRVLSGKSVALVYTSDFRPEALDALAERAVVLAKNSPPDEANVLAEPAPENDKLELHDPQTAALGPDDLLNRVIEAEHVARSADPRIKATNTARGSRGDAQTLLTNTHGVSRRYATTFVGMFLSVLADDADHKQRQGNDATSQRFLSDLKPPEDLGKEAARRAIRMIGAHKVKTESLPVLMHPDVVKDWIQNLFFAFSGEQVFKKASFMGDKLGQHVASPLVTLVDDPHRLRAVGGGPCDDEGVPTRKVVLIDKGVAREFVYNLRWAAKAGAKSTGHASRGYTSLPGIGPNSLYVENGTTPVSEMIRSLDRGFYLVDTGAFGYDPPTGGWSYQAMGLMIEKGELGEPVTDVSLASDTLTMLKGVRSVGNDLKFEGGTNAPHLLLEEMALSGS